MPSVGRWLAACVDELAAHRSRIDDLNVFPVADGDTGTNMLLTCVAAWQAWDESREPGGPDLLGDPEAAIRGALLGARGNSGVIWAQWLHGVLAESRPLPESELEPELKTEPDQASCLLASMLRRGSDEAWGAVLEPVDGTILTVARAAALGAEQACVAGLDLMEACQAALVAARQALDRTPEQLPVLARAGVVDAGGAGLVVVLDALVTSMEVHAAERPALAVANGELDASLIDTHLPQARSLHGDGHMPVLGECASPVSAGEYEVMFVLEAPRSVMEQAKDELARIGTSIVVVGGSDTWKVHVHTRQPGRAIDLAIGLGGASGFQVAYLPEPEPDDADHMSRRLVSVAHGPGTSALLESAGVVTIHGQPRTRPSVGEFADAITAAGSREVIILPSDGDARISAEHAAARARESGLRVAVVPTRSIVQTIAAVAVHDSEATFDSDVAVMAATAGATRYAGVTIASRAALTSGGECKQGDVLGIVDGDIVVVGSDVTVVVHEVIDRMLAMGGDLVTIVLGADAPGTLRDGLPSWARQSHPLVDLVLHDGGQPLWPAIIGVE